MTMQWPKDNQPADFSDLAGALRKAFEFGYDFKRKNEDKDIPWNGPPHGPACAVTCLDPTDALTAKNLRYSLADQGRDLLDELLALALQMGIEQGRRERRTSAIERLRRMRLEHIQSFLTEMLEDE